LPAVWSPGRCFQHHTIGSKLIQRTEFSSMLCQHRSVDSSNRRLAALDPMKSRVATDPVCSSGVSGTFKQPKVVPVTPNRTGAELNAC
jgi:hypothetical protein